MMNQKKILQVLRYAVVFVGLWLFFRYLFPVLLPFGMGLLLALAAEPAVHFGSSSLKLPRWAATGLGVSLTLLILLTLTGAVGAVMVKELGVLARRLPDLQKTAGDTVVRLQVFLETAADSAPESIRPIMTRAVNGMFSSSAELVDQLTVRLPGAVSGFLSRVPDSVLGIGTGILSAFMVSARLPRLKRTVEEKMPDALQNQLIPAIKRSKAAILGWLKAQLKLCGITFCVLAVGFLLLRIPYGILWAAVIALVDAVPLLGTGTVLIPWALISLFQQRHLRAIGLLCLFGAAVLTRTVLEPRLVGRHLGIDPLVTLIFLYLGYRFWGLAGMLLAPMVVAAVTAAGRSCDTGFDPKNADL